MRTTTRCQTRRAGSALPTRFVSYQLDNGGNRLSTTQGAPGFGTPAYYTTDHLNEYTQAPAGPVTNNPEHEIGAHSDVNYRYLGDRLLASVSSSNAGMYELGYDALGRTVKRTTNGNSLYYAYAGARAIVEFTPGGALQGSNLCGLGVNEVIAHGTLGVGQYPFQNRLGSTSAIADETGTIIEQYGYDAFGTPEFRSGPGWSTPRGTVQSTTMINNRILFTGREWVQNYGFYEYRARAYSPALGRFMSEDPTGFAAGDANLFRYCGGDPVNRMDPMGTLSRQPNNTGKPPPLIRPNEAKHSASYTPTGSNIPITGDQAAAQGYGSTLNGFSNFIRDSVPEGFSSSASFGDLARSAFQNAAWADVGAAFQGSHISVTGGAYEQQIRLSEIVRTIFGTPRGSELQAQLFNRGYGLTININSGGFDYSRGAPGSQIMLI
ncbi:MAG: RHS repeat-associated core domain-containing protein [Chthoniobacterales bacterium]